MYRQPSTGFVAMLLPAVWMRCAASTHQYLLRMLHPLTNLCPSPYEQLHAFLLFTRLAAG
jgi:hypothetical protein